MFCFIAGNGGRDMHRFAQPILVDGSVCVYQAAFVRTFEKAAVA